MQNNQFFSKRISFRVIEKLSVLVIALAILTSCLDSIFNPNGHYPLASDSIRQADTATLHFMVLSDWGFNGGFSQKEVAAEMATVSKQSGASFILTCGDNFQYNGVDSVTDKLWQQNFESVYSDNALQIPWFPALGNHDYYGNPDAEVAYTKLSNRWTMPSRYYTFVRKIDTRDSARFIVMDTQGLINAYGSLSDTSKLDSIPQYAWIKSVLSHSSQKWIFVTGHHPVYSASSFHGDTYEMNKIIKPLFDKYHVDFYICGHDHDFEHAKARMDYTDYIVTGTGGYVRPKGENERTIFSLSTPGFTYLSVSYNKAKLYFITSDGHIGYEYEKKK